MEAQWWGGGRDHVLWWQARVLKAGHISTRVHAAGQPHCIHPTVPASLPSPRPTAWRPLTSWRGRGSRSERSPGCPLPGPGGSGATLAGWRHPPLQPGRGARRAAPAAWVKLRVEEGVCEWGRTGGPGRRGQGNKARWPTSAASGRQQGGCNVARIPGHQPAPAGTHPAAWWAPAAGPPRGQRSTRSACRRRPPCTAGFCSARGGASTRRRRGRRCRHRPACRCPAGGRGQGAGEGGWGGGAPPGAAASGLARSTVLAIRSIPQGLFLWPLRILLVPAHLSEVWAGHALVSILQGVPPAGLLPPAHSSGASGRQGVSRHAGGCKSASGRQPGSAAGRPGTPLSGLLQAPPQSASTHGCWKGQEVQSCISLRRGQVSICRREDSTPSHACPGRRPRGPHPRCTRGTGTAP